MSKKRKSCHYREQRDNHGIYKTSCRKTWCTENGDRPRDCGAKFCCFCGRV